ncbi:MAG: hypothetical protein SGARI_008107, partial [Bacillariaceae sp.]
MKVFRYSKNEKKEGEDLSTIEGFPHLYDDAKDDVIDFQNTNTDDAAVEDGDDAGQPTKSSQEKSTKKRRMLCYGGIIALALILVVSLGSYGIANKRSAAATSSSSTSASTFCQPAGIKDTKEPFLELTLFAGSNRLVNEMEAKFLENAVMDGYNEASGGCTDEYERWTY